MPKQAQVDPNGFRAMARRCYLATVGAFAVLDEEAAQLVDRLANKGQKVEEEGKNLVRDRIEERRQKAKKQAEQVDERIETVLSRMNLPSKSDVRDLDERISQLSAKVDALQEAQMQAEVDDTAEDDAS
jgi:poly(hydroxyalkanoate) granule-associated protein